MEISKADQIALDDALVALANRLKIEKQSSISSDVNFQRMQLFHLYMIVLKSHLLQSIPSPRLMTNNTKHILKLDQFRDILQICPKVGNEKFEEPPLKKEILEFLASLGHSGEIRKITDSQGQLHSPQRKESEEAGKGNRRLKDEGTGVSPGVPDAPDYDSDDDISWKSSEDDQDEDKNEDDENVQDDDDDAKSGDDELKSQDDQDDDDEAQTESEEIDNEVEGVDVEGEKSDEDATYFQATQKLKTLIVTPNSRLKALEDNFSEFKQTNQYAEALSSIPGIVDQYLANKMKEAVDVAVQLKSDRI
ncbi:hypothetical protein Tco_0489683 [Tanacetum coccineum]